MPRLPHAQPQRPLGTGERTATSLPRRSEGDASPAQRNAHWTQANPSPRQVLGTTPTCGSEHGPKRIRRYLERPSWPCAQLRTHADTHDGRPFATALHSHPRHIPEDLRGEARSPRAPRPACAPRRDAQASLPTPVAGCQCSPPPARARSERPRGGHFCPIIRFAGSERLTVCLSSRWSVAASIGHSTG